MQMNFNLLSAKRFLFISPHHDDMIYSCGGIIKKLLQNKKSVLNVNIFSISDWSSIENIEKESISSIRKMEEQAIALDWGFSTLDLDFPDSSMRGLDAVQELSSKVDNMLLEDIKTRLSNVVPDLSYDVVFLPRAIGNHIDHLYALSLSDFFSCPVIYYEDLPYSYFFASVEDGYFEEILVDVTEYYEDKIKGIYNYYSQLETKNINAIMSVGKHFIDGYFIERIWVRNEEQ